MLQLIDAHNHRPVGGLWSGRSPEDWMTQKVDAGWKPALVDTDALDAAFSDSDSRRVDRGVLKINGKRYSHPDIAALPSADLPARLRADNTWEMRAAWHQIADRNATEPLATFSRHLDSTPARVAWYRGSLAGAYP